MDVNRLSDPPAVDPLLVIEPEPPLKPPQATEPLHEQVPLNPPKKQTVMKSRGRPTLDYEKLRKKERVRLRKVKSRMVKVSKKSQGPVVAREEALLKSLTYNGLSSQRRRLTQCGGNVFHLN